MANIVELRGMSGDKLRDLLENAREEMFNLRFQKATAQLDDVSRIRQVRREVAQLETVLRMRQLAKDTAASQPEIATALAGKVWRATARFNYEESAWRVEFADENNKELATAVVDLNKKGPAKGRKGRQTTATHNLITSYTVAG